MSGYDTDMIVKGEAGRSSRYFVPRPEILSLPLSRAMLSSALQYPVSNAVNWERTRGCCPGRGAVMPGLDFAFTIPASWRHLAGDYGSGSELTARSGKTIPDRRVISSLPVAGPCSRLAIRRWVVEVKICGHVGGELPVDGFLVPSTFYLVLACSRKSRDLHRDGGRG